MQDSQVCLVLHALKYGEKSMIIKTLHESGLQSYFLNNYTKKGKNIYPFLSWPLALVEIDSYTRNKSSLPFIKNISLAYVPQNITRDVLRQSVALFMADVVYHFIREENDQVETIYSYINKAILSLDNCDFLSVYFPVKFGYDMANLMGYGITVKEKPGDYFNKKSLQFQNDHNVDCFGKNTSRTFAALLQSDIDEINNIEAISQTGKELFQSMLDFFRTQIPESGTLKSPQILRSLYK